MKITKGKGKESIIAQVSLCFIVLYKMSSKNGNIQFLVQIFIPVKLTKLKKKCRP